MQQLILCTSPTFGKYSSKALKTLEEAGCRLVRVSREEALDREKLFTYVKDAEGWIVGFSKITREILDAAPRLKVAAKHGTGTDNFDLAAAREKGVVIANAPGLNANAVAELAFGLMLSLARKIPYADMGVRTGMWEPVMGIELAGKTLGVIGMGTIGKNLMKKAAAFGMDLLAYDVARDMDLGSAFGVKYVDDYREVLTRSDFISLHVPLNKKTRGMIGSEEFHIMKSSTFLINTSRGGVVDEAALYQALITGQIAGAGTDVFEQEPPALENPLLGLDNVVIAPHMGAYTQEAMAKISEVCAENVVRVLQGREPLFRVV